MATPMARPMIAPAPKEEESSLWRKSSSFSAPGADAEETELLGAVDDAVEKGSVVFELAVVDASVSELRAEVVAAVEDDVLSSPRLELERAGDVGAGPMAVIEPTTSPSGSSK